MRTVWTAIVAVALLAVVLPQPGASQAMTFDDTTYVLHGGYGDIPTTTYVEPSTTWNLEQRLLMKVANHNGNQVMMDYPSGSQVIRMNCTCGVNGFDDGDHAVFNFAAVADGNYSVFVTSTQPYYGKAWAVSFFPLEMNNPADMIAVLYAPPGEAIDACVPPAQAPMPAVSSPQTIYVFGGAAHPINCHPTWFTIRPAVAGTTVTPPTTGPDTTTTAPASTNWLYLAAAFIAGLVLWAILVSRGIVQRKQRKQVASTAAHVEAAQGESVAILEGRKRALMAALKEIELARQANELDVPTYDTLKAELKKEAVTVMRAIDEAGTKKA